MAFVQAPCDGFHPMEFGAPRIDTEPLPEYHDPINEHDPLYGHCTIHCTNDLCKGVPRVAKNEPVKLSCVCEYAQHCRHQQDPVPAPPLPSNIALETPVTPDEEAALENLKTDAEIRISITDAASFVKNLDSSDANDPAALISSLGFMALETPDRMIYNRRSWEELRGELLEYFNKTLSPENPVRFTTPYKLRLEVRGCLIYRLNALCDEIGAEWPLIPNLPFEDSLKEGTPMYEIWQCWGKVVDDLTRMFVLADLRRRAESKTDANAEKRKEIATEAGEQEGGIQQHESGEEASTTDTLRGGSDAGNGQGMERTAMASGDGFWENDTKRRRVDSDA